MPEHRSRLTVDTRSQSFDEVFADFSVLLQRYESLRNLPVALVRNADHRSFVDAFVGQEKSLLNSPTRTCCNLRVFTERPITETAYCSVS